MLGFTPLSGAPLSDLGESSGDDSLDASLPLKTLVADDGDRAESTLPVVTLEAEGFGGTLGDAAATLPALTLSATPGGATLDEDLPLLTVSAAGPPTGVLESELPSLLSDAAGSGETLGVLDVELPELTLFAYGDHALDEVLPTKSLDAFGEAGAFGVLNTALAALTLEAAGVHHTLGALDDLLPIVMLEAAGYHSTSGALAAELPALLAAGEALSGQDGALDEPLPLLALGAAGYADVVGSLVETLPALIGSGLGITPATGTFRTWVMNLRTGALTEYTGWQFNSYATIGGRTLAASEDGLFTLGTEDKDDEADISAAFAGPRDSLKSPQLKRAPYVYLGIEAPGKMYVKLTTTEGGSASYDLLPEGPGLRNRRVKAGEGVRSRYWQWEVGNKAGADFRVESVSPYFQEMKRRLV